MECVPSALLESVLSYLSIDEVVIVRRSCRHFHSLPWEGWIHCWSTRHGPNYERYTLRCKLLVTLMHITGNERLKVRVSDFYPYSKLIQDYQKPTRKRRRRL